MKIVKGTCFVIAIIVIVFLLNEFNMNDIETTSQVLEEGKFSYNNDGTITLGPGLTSFGFRDNNNNLIDNGSLIIPSSSVVNGTVNFQQNLEASQQYVLIFMIDYTLHEFFVDGKSYTNYHFSLDEVDEIFIEVNLNDISDDKGNLSYFIFNDIDTRDLYEKDIKDLTMFDLRVTTQMWSGKFLLPGWESKNIIYERENIYESNDDYGIRLVENYDNHIEVPYITKNEEYNIIMSNIETNETNYAIIALSNWEQCEISDDVITKYVSILPNENIYIKYMTTNNIDTTDLRFISIPRPYSNERNYDSPITTFMYLFKPLVNN